jgi:hypothetical protein
MSKHIETFLKLLDQPDIQACLGASHRADLLPLLFRVRGEPYSLQDYPQFREMYASEYVANSLWLCGRQLGKSMNLSRSEILDLTTIPHFQILYVAPLEKQAQRYSTLYLQEAINSCPLAKYLQATKEVMSDSSIVKSVHHQAFATGAGIQLTYAKTSPDRARGIFADRIDFDEVQDQLADHVTIISESLTASRYAVSRFTGTAKTVDNTIEDLWQKSSMCEWSMKCEGCNKWNRPTQDDQVLKMIHVDGLRCVKCGHKLNPRLGSFVPSHPDRMKVFRGYHIPQIVVPAIVEDPVKWSNLVQKVLTRPLPFIMQEVLGISCSEGARIITQADIEKQSILPSMKDLQAPANIGKYMFTIGGVDWGGAEHTSFTVHTIMGVRSDGKIDVIYAQRFMGFNPEEQLQLIAKAHYFYNCKALAADYGMGFDKNVILHQRYGIPVIQIQLLRQNRLLNYNPLMGQERWTADKVTALEVTFLSIKYGRIYFPPQTEFKTFTDDLLSPYEETSEVGGISYRKFLRNPKRPDDFAMALMFACLVAMKMLNIELTDLIPSEAYGPMDDIPPGFQSVDPAEILSSM